MCERYLTLPHISWTRRDGEPGSPAWMFGLSTKYCSLGCGAFEFPKPMLEAYRAVVAGKGGEQFAEIINGLEKSAYRVSDPALKRVPSGFPADHPRAQYLRHKGIAAWRDLDGPQNALEPDIDKSVVASLKPMLPLWRFLSNL